MPVVWGKAPHLSTGNSLDRWMDERTLQPHGSNRSDVGGLPGWEALGGGHTK